MKKSLFVACLVSLSLPVAAAFELDKSVMSAKYWAIWNDVEQARIDADIERNRKTEVEIEVGGRGEGAVPFGTEVKVEQISHAFFFGAQIFNFNQLGTPERNRRYRELYGTVFNSATVAFYWSNFEPFPNAPRFAPRYEDSEAFWNACANPEQQPHWRRPPTDAPIDWCLARGVRVHAHPLVYLAGNSPIWLYGQFFPQEERDRTGFPEVEPGVFLKSFDDWKKTKYAPWYANFRKTHTEEDFARLAPRFTANLRRLQDKRIAEIAAYYGDRIASCDVVNETRESIDLGRPIPSGVPVTFGNTGVEGGDFVIRAFRSAARGFPASVRLNINDNTADARYTNEVARLIAAGAKIDVIGSQMHLFSTNIVREIGEFGADCPKDNWDRAKRWAVATPADVRARFALFAPLKRPLHYSEITISAPGTDAKAQMMQAVFTWNLYRIWFSQPNLTGITWWNVVDGCGYPGEPSTSGLFTREMEPKPVFRMMEDLVRREWRTELKSKVEGEGERRVVRFRGFRGRYRLSWKGTDGKDVSKVIEVK